jgi:methionyl-tRNA formyltransferase|tara:strand:+ start:409 stop:1416 length:1008 start_codon:yes stop_codon:yes gene_type:complete
VKKIVFVSHNYFGASCLKEILRLLSTELKGMGKVELIIAREYNPNISDYSSEFKHISREYGSDLMETGDINSLKEEIASRKPDFIFVFGWSQIIDSEILSIPKVGILGTHPSLLPKNRGSAAIPWQILNEEKLSGVTLFFLNEKVDSGDIIAQEKFALKADETAESFYEKVIDAGKKIIQNNLKVLLLGKYSRIQQNNYHATYLSRRTPGDGFIDWSRDRRSIYKLIHAVGKPYPGAYTHYDYKKIIVLEAEIPSQSNYQGTTGSIIEKLEDGVLVQTGDGLLKIKRILVEDEGSFDATNYLKIGKKIGLSCEDEIIFLRKELGKLKKVIKKMRG